MPVRTPQGYWVFTQEEQQALTARFLAGEDYVALAAELKLPMSTLRRMILRYCQQQNPTLIQQLGWPPRAIHLRAHAGAFVAGLPSWRPPLASRNQVIAERFAAGDSYRVLACDYGLSVERITQIVHGYSLQQARHDHMRLLPPSRYRQRRIPQAQLRSHLQRLLARVDILSGLKGEDSGKKSLEVAGSGS